MDGRVAGRMGLIKSAGAGAVNAVCEVISEALAKEDAVRIAGLGTFATTSGSTRTGRNPRTGENVSIAATKAPWFKAGTGRRGHPLGARPSSRSETYSGSFCCSPSSRSETAFTEKRPIGDLRCDAKYRGIAGSESDATPATPNFPAAFYFTAEGMSQVPLTASPSVEKTGRK